MTGKAIIYARVSTTRQAEEGLSLDNQVEKAKRYIEDNKLEIKGIFRDEGKSGGSMKGRDGLKNAIAALGTGDVFIVYSLSRLARNTKECLTLNDEIKKKKATLVSLTEKIDGTSTGQLLLQMVSAVSEWERSVCSERVKSIMQNKILNGEYIGGTVPYGYILDSDNRKLIPVPQEQRVIQRIIKMKNEKKSYRAISRQLDEDGVSCPKSSKKWHHYSIKLIYERHKPPTEESLSSN